MQLTSARIAGLIMNNVTAKAFLNCTSCQLCSAVCPTEAIRIEVDEDGFYIPIVNDNKCIDCGLCKKYCYKYDDSISINMGSNTTGTITYAAQSKDKDLLQSSSSGGIATHIAKECLRQGYNIIGVSYDTQRDISIHRVATNLKEIQAFKGSKYMQSYTERAFKELIEDQTNQKYAVFGTPCQIYALRRYIQQTRREDRFILIDIFCHGCPSMFLWMKYIQFIKQRLNTNKFDKVSFRSKIHGWHEYCHHFTSGNIEYVSRKTNDPFFTLFFDNNALSKACYKCKTRSTLEYTDIRLGDFWGIEYSLNTEGVSAVILVSKKGKDIFNKIKDKLVTKEHNLGEVSKFQSFGVEYSYDKEMRRRTLNLLKTDKGISSIVNEYKKWYSPRKKIKSYMKQVAYVLPKHMRDRIKKIYYKMRTQ